MQKTERWVVALVVVALLGGVGLLRHMLRSPEPEVQSVVPAKIPERNKTPGYHGTSSQSLGSDDGFDTAQGNAPITAENEVTTGDVPAALKAARPDAGTGLRGRMEVGANNPEAAVPADVGGADAGPTPAVAGAALSVSFSGSANGRGDQATPLYAQGLDFDPNLGFARFPPSALLAYPDNGGLNTQQGTITFWVRREWDPSLPLTKSLVELLSNTWANRFEVAMGPTFIRLLITNSDGTEQGVGAAIQWGTNDWHHFAASWGDELMSLYIDGSMKDQEPYTASVVIPPDAMLFVGSSPRGPSDKGPENQGTVSMQGFNIYPQVLTPEQVALLASVPPPSQ